MSARRGKGRSHSWLALSKGTRHPTPMRIILLTSGAIGKPAMIAAKTCIGWGGDKFLEQSACHVLDLIRFYMGDLSSLTAYGVNQFGRTPYPFDNASNNDEIQVRRGWQPVCEFIWPVAQALGADRDLWRPSVAGCGRQHNPDSVR